ncbi:UNVERIFIED_CONTAM: protein CHROMATIN REMODELING 24 [Sesamum calycinum]|uniref:Protein CHROMATIN REMODELING 24 n=1 Tax=Sesamum calycinum TaxID=2727403 RepID=A0AAW2SY19_9LAMI
MVEDNTQWKVKTVESTEGNDDVPRFDFDITSPSPLQEREVYVDEEPVSTKIKDSSPQLFAGIADFDSPSPSFASEPRESSKSTEDGGSSCEANPTISGSSEYSTNLSVYEKLEHIGLESTKVSDIEDNASKKKSLLSGGVDHASSFRGEERQTKVKIEGRRRLCRISKNNDSESAAGRNSIRAEEPKFDGISDFDSPPQVNKTCETAGNEIRDILNDLSARLEILSIEKKRVPKKVDPMEDFQDSVRSKLHDLTIKEGVPEYHNAASSYRHSSDSLDNTIESSTSWKYSHKVRYSKREKLLFPTVTVLEDHVDDFTLSGPKLTYKYKLPGKLAKNAVSSSAGRIEMALVSSLYFATCTKTRHYELQYVLQDKGVLLTTYDIVRNNVKSLCGDYHYNDDGDEDETTWDYMILDEELWALFNFCCPELLGDKKEFKEKYEHFINRGNEKNASDREKRIGSAVARRQLYEAFLKSEIVLSACDGSPLAALTILKKICDHPLLLTKRAAEDVLEGMDSIVDQEDHRVAERLAMHIADVAERFDIVENHDISCKISFILSLLGDLVPKGHNVLIFSQTRKMLNLIQESLISNHYKYIRIDGTTKASDRAKIVKDFQEGHGAPVFLLTTQVGGLGLTLTNADRVIVVDPAWNPSTDNQSVDRAYRIGQKKDVIVYRLMTCGTVEEKIYRKQVFKGGLFRSATEHKEQIRYFSQQDLRDLFSLPKQGFDVSPTQQQLLEEHDHQHTMEESLRAHVEFLETLSIAGISQHNLLFSKAAPLQAVEIEEEAGRLRGSRFIGNPPTRSSIEQNVDGAHYAFNPKDIKKIQKNSNPHVREPSEDEIRARINRLSQIFADKAAVSRLPDKGEKIHRQITSLNLQLDQLRMAKRNKEDVIEL